MKINTTNDSRMNRTCNLFIAKSFNVSALKQYTEKLQYLQIQLVMIIVVIATADAAAVAVVIIIFVVMNQNKQLFDVNFLNNNEEKLYAIINTNRKNKYNITDKNNSDRRSFYTI